MSEFQGKRVSHQYTQTNNASPDEVFLLLCPVLEAEWVPDWRYRLIYSQSGVAELGCVFATPNEDGSETTWVVTHYDPAAFRIGFVWVNPGIVAAYIEICLRSKSAAAKAPITEALIRYTYTGLSPAGNRELERYDRRWFEHKMKSWQTAINHYLQTGKKIEATAWE